MADGAAPRSESFASKVATVVFAVLLVALVFALRHVLLLVFGAILIAVGLRGLAEGIERHTPLGRRASLAASGLLVLGILVAAFWMLGAQISTQLAQLFERLPTAWDEVQSRMANNEYGRSVMREIQSAISNGGPGQIGAFASRLGRFTMSAAGASLELLIVIIAAVFLTIDADTYRDGALALAPKGFRDKLREAMRASSTALRKWLLGTLVSMLFLGTTVTIGLWLLGVPAPLALGLLSGLAQFVPLIGPIISAAPGILLAFTVGPETALWAALLYFGASQVEANLVTPLIQQRAVSLPPALTLFAVIGAGLALGPLGALFATPLVVVISVFVVIFYVRGVLGDRKVQAPGS
jgi:predicted PurR-regulated permease PerM